MKSSPFSALSRFWTFWSRFTKRRENLWQPSEFPADHYEVLLATAAHIGEASVMVAHAFDRVQLHRS